MPPSHDILIISESENEASEQLQAEEENKPFAIFGMDISIKKQVHKVCEVRNETVF